MQQWAAALGNCLAATDICTEDYIWSYFTLQVKCREKPVTSVHHIQPIGKAPCQKDNTEVISSDFLNSGQQKGTCRTWTMQKIAFSSSQHQRPTPFAFLDAAVILLQQSTILH